MPQHERGSALVDEENDPDHLFDVVVNDEGQYSIWEAERAVPDGWQQVGVRGPKAACLAHIETVWTDMRPRSLREQQAGGPPAGP
jgi:MbtH protein